jgi:hypothetical protein
VLWFERQVVAALTDPALDDSARAAVAGHVDLSLRSMPEHLRAGVVAESLLFGALPLLQRALGRFNARQLHAQIEQWRTSRIDLVRQYVRLLQSLVLFAEHELVWA